MKRASTSSSRSLSSPERPAGRVVLAGSRPFAFLSHDGRARLAGSSSPIRYRLVYAGLLKAPLDVEAPNIGGGATIVRLTADARVQNHFEMAPWPFRSDRPELAGEGGFSAPPAGSPMRRRFSPASQLPTERHYARS